MGSQLITCAMGGSVDNGGSHFRHAVGGQPENVMPIFDGVGHRSSSNAKSRSTVAR